ncbi:MAG: hypothetical protein ACREB5_11235 [Sphingomonadaceae bacterium]
MTKASRATSSPMRPSPCPLADFDDPVAAAAHILAQIARWQGRDIYAFLRAGDAAAQALSLGAMWAGAADDRPLGPLNAAIIFVPVESLVPQALKAVRKGGASSAAAST